MPEIILLDSPLEKYKNNLLAIDQVVDIGNDVADFAKDSLENLLKEYQEIPGFLPLKQKTQTTINLLGDFKNHKVLEEKYSIIYNQALALIVANFESFLNELIVVLVEDYPFLIDWPDKKLSLDLSVFKYSKQTVGEIILRSLREKYNFQDLKSTLCCLKDYLSLDINPSEDLKDDIIFCHAQRHIVIHNSGRVNEQFLQQIRDTKYAVVYSKDKMLKITREDYANAKNKFVEFGELITENIKNKLEEFIPF